VVRPFGRSTHTAVSYALGCHLRGGAFRRGPKAVEQAGGRLTALHCLICRIGGRDSALPLEHVREVMRPGAIERIELAPEYLLGLALIRGQMVPVIDAGVLLMGQRGKATRFVVLRVEERRVALAVAEVVGTRALDQTVLDGLPPLLANKSDLIAHMAVLDGKLVEVLDSGRLVEVATRHADAEATA
jgi:chemotaxis signal transduction protein